MRRIERVALVALAAGILIGTAWAAASLRGGDNAVSSSAGTVYLEAVPSPDILNVSAPILNFSVFLKNPGDASVSLLPNFTVSLLSYSGGQAVASVSEGSRGAVAIPPRSLTLVYNGSIEVASLPRGAYWLSASSPPLPGVNLVGERIMVQLV